MSTIPISIRSLLMTALCVLGARALTAAYTPGIPQTAPGNGYRIAGTIVSKTDGHPLARARVTVRDARNPQKFESLVTPENGKFEFNRLPAGKYDLHGAKRGYISASYDQHEQFSTAIVTGAMPRNPNGNPAIERPVSRSMTSIAAIAVSESVSSSNCS